MVAFEGFRISSQQKQLWARGASDFLAHGSILLEGQPDLRCLQQAVEQVCARHEILRTCFRCLPNTVVPLQVIQETAPLWQEYDWTKLSQSEQAQEIERWLEDRAFDLEQGPLVHVMLARCSADQSVLLVKWPSLCGDHRSVTAFLAEVADAYGRLPAGASLTQDEEVIQYADVTETINDLLESDETQSGRDYWMKRDLATLDGLSLPFGLAGDKRFEPRRVPLDLSPEYRKDAQGENQLLGCWALLLMRLCGRQQIVIGSGFHGRTFEELRQAQGLYEKYLPLPLELDLNQPFSSFLESLHAARQASADYGDYFSWDVVREQSECDHFPFVFDVQELPEVTEAGGLRFSISRADAHVARFGLRLCLTRTATRLSPEIQYDGSLYSEQDVHLLAQQFQALSAFVCDHRSLPLKYVPFLSEQERDTNLKSFNQTAVTIPSGSMVHQLFAQQAARTPEAPALLWEDRTLSFTELDRRANGLANQLQRQGVKADVRVAIYCDRSPDLIVSILAVLKAGGCFVPLDTSYPALRIAYLLDDSQPHLLISPTAMVGNLETEVQVIHPEQTPVGDGKGPTCQIAPENTAYMIYTSGSTGQPKGAMITHAGLSNYLLWARTAYVSDAEGVVPLHSPIGFDLTITSLFLPLISGTPIHILPQEPGLKTLQKLADLFGNSALNFVKLTPAHLDALTRLIPAETIDGVRTLIIGGEALQKEALSSWRARAPHLQIVNEYGPTEAVVGCCVYASMLDEMIEDTSVPIGKPIANTQLYVLDGYLQPVPGELSGELFIGGKGVCRGYHGRPALTAERFVPDHLSSEPGARLYKTGDLVRFQDEQLHFLGRSDFQVKIRGTRIEPGEIEAALLEHAAVQAATVMVDEPEPDEKRLVAYVQVDEPDAMSSEDLRTHLLDRLPEQLVPALYAILPHLPLSRNGKVDRDALSRLTPTARSKHAYVAPRNQVEKILAEIWGPLLHVEQIGVNDNFFTLGGDSILCIQTIARARQQGLQLTLNLIFEHQTIADLAPHVVTAKVPTASQEAVTGEIPLTPIQQWVFERNHRQPHHFNQALMLKVPADLDPAFLQQALACLVAHHDTLRLQFELHGDTPRQFNGAVDDRIPFELKDLSQMPADERSTAVEAMANEAQASMNLEHEPMIKMVLFRGFGTKGNASDRLFIVIHHMAVDAVSWRILLEDLQSGYRQLEEGKQEITLPPKTTSFKEWAQRLQTHAQSAELAKESTYWLKNGAAIPAKLPLDIPAGSHQRIDTQGQASIVSTSLDGDLTAHLLVDANRAYNTRTQDLLLVALARTLASWTGQRHVQVDLEGHGRNDLFEDVDISRTVGFFTSLYPVALDGGAPGAESLEATIKRVKEQLRQIPGGGIGFGLLHYLSQDENLRRQIRELPRSEVLFNYLGQVSAGDSGDDALMSGAEESCGASIGAEIRRDHLLEISAIVVGGKMKFEWSYSKERHKPETVERLAQNFNEELKTLSNHCLAPDTGSYTPSDFPLANLDQETLDQVLAGQADVEDLYPLSPMQEGILYHAVYESESPLYYLQVACRLDGDLNVAAFKQAWSLAINRYSLLRSSFHWKGLEVPLQAVHRQVSLDWTEADWRDANAVDLKRRFTNYLAKCRETGFDFEKAPLMNVALFQTSDDSFRFVWNCHHLQMDGWSKMNFLREIFAHYRALCSNQEPQLPEVRPFREYIAWLQGQDLAEAETYWREQLSGYAAATSLRLSKPSSNEEQTAGYAEQNLMMDARELIRVARDHHLTLNTLIQGAWALLLSCYSGDEDVVFGATVSGRPPTLEGVENLVGLFINTLPVRVSTSQDRPLQEWLQEIQDRQVTQARYAYSPLVEVQGWSDVPRGEPLFETILVVENYLASNMVQLQRDVPEVNDVIEVERNNYPLTLTVVPSPDMLIKITHDYARFDATSMQRICEQLKYLLQQFANTPNAKLSEFSLLTQNEHQQMEALNRTEVTYPKQATIHQFIEARVATHADRIALVCGDRRLTYRDLNQQANQIAHHLRSLGVTAETPVGLCIEREIEMIVGLLGVLKAGGTYVPLDPAYPVERLAYMLQDSKAPVLLTRGKQLSLIADPSVEIVCMDQHEHLLRKQSVENPNPIALGENRAYVIYTSGSTGKPKGVEISHRAAVNFLHSMAKEPGLDERDVMLSVTTISFDIAGLEIYLPLMQGARLVLATRDETGDANLLTQAMERHAITAMQATPATWTLLQTAAWQGRSDLKVLCGGEALPRQLARFLLGGNASVWNLYGPTETTIWSAVRQLKEAASTRDVAMESVEPIGYPIDNTSLYILDKTLHQTPLGVPGELFIGGDGLARGYADRPSLTAQRFIPNPFVTDGMVGERLYRTGDLVRYLPNGHIAFIGRLDHQVKLRGYRIELGEIEAALEDNEHVVRAVSIVREDTPGDQRLAAYVRTREENLANDARDKLSQALRQELRQKLPEYMVPMSIVVLEQFPLTPNGKINRAALPVPEQRSSAVEYVAPGTETEKKVAKIWIKILKTKKLGIHDNFFDSGGHSMLATRMIARLQKTFKVDYSLGYLFEDLCVEKVAARIDRIKRNELQGSAPEEELGAEEEELSI